MHGPRVACMAFAWPCMGLGLHACPLHGIETTQSKSKSIKPVFFNTTSSAKHSS
jgi:hypothetical protein